MREAQSRVLAGEMVRVHIRSVLKIAFVQPYDTGCCFRYGEVEHVGLEGEGQALVSPLGVRWMVIPFDEVGQTLLWGEVGIGFG